jgi:altronate hydrolase
LKIIFNIVLINITHFSQMQNFIRLHPNDNVVIARTQLIGGTVAEQTVVKGLIPAGHKVATQVIEAGQAVKRYNQIIGFASTNIQAGEHIHTHNLNLGDEKGAFARDYAFCSDVKAAPARKHATFMGYKRSDGRVATRNYIGILSSVNCSATVVRAIADHFSRRTNPSALAPYPNIDGVIALSHGLGCGMDHQGLGMQVLERTLAGYARHANFAACLMVGLGCEANQISTWLEHSHLSHDQALYTYNIQDTGGTAKSIALGIEQVKTMLASANAVQREPVDVSHLTVGLQCGGSDGYSGISANPALGAAVDLLVAYGGTAILSETPEIYGAEHLLTRRAVTKEVGEKLIQRIRWWEHYTHINQGEMNNNPSPGNKAGGLTTILEKSLGAVAKGGTTNLNAVYEYAQTVDTHGFVYMDTPGYDPVSATGQVAGGANLICFTTGRGSAYGCAPSPSLKLSTNTALWSRQQEDIDINCGSIVDGTNSIEEMGQLIFEQMIKSASGQATKSELHGYGQSEFVPWQLGAVM